MRSPPPSEPSRPISGTRLSSWWLISKGDQPTHPDSFRVRAMDGSCCQDQRRLRSFPWQRGQGIRDVGRLERWNSDRNVYARDAKGATADPRSAGERLASARSKDRNSDRQRSQTGHVFCETCPQRGERIATEKNDARPSDCIAMATQQRAPIYVSLDVWNEVEDMTEVLRKMEKGSQTEQNDQEEDS